MTSNNTETLTKVKNIRAKLLLDCEKHVINVFKNADDAYMYSSGLYESLNTHSNAPDVRKLSLIEDDFIDAEWLGCEYKYDKQTATKVNKYRIVKATDIHNELGMLVSMYEGWILDADLPNKKCTTFSLDINLIEQEEQLFDFSVLFNDINIVDDYEP